jgi:hypothetical protein
MKKKPTKPEPTTDLELQQALEEIGCELIDHDSDDFSVRLIKTGSATHLEAEDYSSALFEAWNLMKP